MDGIVIGLSQRSIFFNRVEEHRALGLVPAGQVYPPPVFSSPNKQRIADTDPKSTEAKLMRRLRLQAGIGRKE